MRREIVGSPGLVQTTAVPKFVCHRARFDLTADAYWYVNVGSPGSARSETLPDFDNLVASAEAGRQSKLGSYSASRFLHRLADANKYPNKPRSPDPVDSAAELAAIAARHGLVAATEWHSLRHQSGPAPGMPAVFADVVMLQRSVLRLDEYHPFSQLALPAHATSQANGHVNADQPRASASLRYCHLIGSTRWPGNNAAPMPRVVPVVFGWLTVETLPGFVVPNTAD